LNPLVFCFTHVNFVSEEKNPMPLTILDPNTALIVIDLQKGIVNGNFIHPIGEVIDRTRSANRCFPCEEPSSRAGQRGGTGAGTDGTGSAQQPSFSEGWTDLLPQLDQQPSDIVVTKRSWGAFATTDLEAPAQGARRYPGGCDGSGDLRWR
jgi:nicotinamidase-related amidase